MHDLIDQRVAGEDHDFREKVLAQVKPTTCHCNLSFLWTLSNNIWAHKALGLQRTPKMYFLIKSPHSTQPALTLPNLVCLFLMMLSGTSQSKGTAVPSKLLPAVPTLIWPCLRLALCRVSRSGEREQEILGVSLYDSSRMRSQNAAACARKGL